MSTAVATTGQRPSLVAKIAARYSVDPTKLLDTLKATAFKQKEGSITNEQMMALLVVADQYGLNPFTKEIFAFPDKQNGIVPVVGVDGWSRLINGNDKFDGVEFRYSDEIITGPGHKPCPAWCEAIIYRKDRSHPTIVREDFDEVFRAPFKGKRRDGGGEFTVDGPWQSHTKRMLRHKALIQCARVAFGYVGIYDEDEAARIVERDITHEATVERVEPLRAQIKRKEAAAEPAADHIRERLRAAQSQDERDEIADLIRTVEDPNERVGLSQLYVELSDKPEGGPSDA